MIANLVANWAVIAAALAIALVLLAGAGVMIHRRNLHYWLAGYLADLGAARGGVQPPRHVYFCFADHFEPVGATRDPVAARQRTREWLAAYDRAAADHRDSDGRPPVHSFFYPAEEYDAEIVDQLAAARRRGLGDVEVHLHHDNDTADNLRATLRRFVTLLSQRHGLLRRDPASGRIAWCFIHGNWALDNSRPDGRWCGVSNELAILADEGCVADLTMPSAPSDTQTRKINSLYFSQGRHGHCKSHDTGRDAATGDWAAPGELLMIQGPLTLNWREGRLGLLPRIESGELSLDAPATAHRVALWGRCGIAVRGAGEHVFIKIHTHGATDRSMRMLFQEGGLDRLWRELARQYRDREGCSLHYVSAWQMYLKIRELATEPEHVAAADPAGVPA